MKPSYDQIQLAAVLQVCQQCQQQYWMTVPKQPCIACRRKQATVEDEANLCRKR